MSKWTRSQEIRERDYRVLDTNPLKKLCASERGVSETVRDTMPTSESTCADDVPKNSYQRVKDWRRRNPERYRAYMREYMRARRAK